METIIIYVCIFFIAFVIFVINSVKFRKKEQLRIDNFISGRFGVKGSEKLTDEDFARISYYFKNCPTEDFCIDDITYNDLDMNEIFVMLNQTYSSLGEEYLYKKLRTLNFHTDFEEEEQVYHYFEEHQSDALALQKIFYQLGKNKNHSIYQLLERFKDVKRGNNIIHYLCCVLFVVGFALLFIQPVIGIFAFLGVLVFNIGTYYKYRNQIAEYFVCFRYLIDMIRKAEEIIGTDIKGISDECDKMKENIQSLKSVTRGAFLIGIHGNSGSIAEIVMDYVRMIFHIDIIKFHQMSSVIAGQIDSVFELYERMGKIESMLAVSSFRAALDYYCQPEFTEENCVVAEEMFHPLLEHPVSNSIAEKKSVLITGSNASGKSTFLKSVAINLIFAQTIHTCTAKKIKFRKSGIYSSMALRDSIMTNESYFMVEIRSIKRIVDALHGEIPVICFIDEVLRGTNTVERIATSTEILGTIAEKNALCFAATHDIELADLLRENYSNYHFTEQLKDRDIHFDYKIHAGKATSKNAIMLLSAMGFDDEIVSLAQKRAEQFMENGSWMK